MKSILMIKCNEDRFDEESNILYNFGYYTMIARTPEEVKNLCKLRKFDLVIFDIPTNNEMCGHYLSFIKSISNQSVTILLAECQNDGKFNRPASLIVDDSIDFDHIIHKPIGIWDFLDHINSICGYLSTNVNRISLKSDLEIFDGKNYFFFGIENLSSSGMCFKGYNELKNSDFLHMRFNLLENDMDIKAIGKVIWCQKKIAKKSIFFWKNLWNYYGGIKITQIKATDKLRIKQFVESHTAQEKKSKYNSL